MEGFWGFMVIGDLVVKVYVRCGFDTTEERGLWSRR